MSDDMCLVGNPDCGVYSICDACARAIGEEDDDCARCDELQAKVEQMRGLVEETLIWYKTFSSDEANRRLHEAVEKYRRPDA